MEVTRRRGRRRKKLLDDFKDRRGYSHLKEEALDRTMWRNRFGGGFGPVVRQNTEWINYHVQQADSSSAFSSSAYLLRNPNNHNHAQNTSRLTVSPNAQVNIARICVSKMRFNIIFPSEIFLYKYSINTTWKRVPVVSRLIGSCPWIRRLSRDVLADASCRRWLCA